MINGGLQSGVEKKEKTNNEIELDLAEEGNNVIWGRKCVLMDLISIAKNQEVAPHCPVVKL